MRFESRSYWHPKDIDFPREYEDAFAIGENGVVAVADGVASAIFSRQWADILTRAVTESAPDLTDGEAFQAWLADARLGWTNAIDFTKLSFFQRGKLQQVGGAYSTLLWVEFFPTVEIETAGESDGISYRCYAVGDCCLFHIRNGRLLRKFPLETVEQFEEDPITICSVNRNRDHLVEFDMVDDRCDPGDLLILASDALAKWWYQRLADEQAIDWSELWGMSSEDWSALVTSLRNLPGEQRMRVDDTTLVMLRMGDMVTDEAREVQPGPHVVIAPPSIQATEDIVTDDDSESADADRQTVELASAEESVEDPGQDALSEGSAVQDADPSEAADQNANCIDQIPDEEAIAEDRGEVQDAEAHASDFGREVQPEEGAPCVVREEIIAEPNAEDPDSLGVDNTDGPAAETQSGEEIAETTPHSSSD